MIITTIKRLIIWVGLFTMSFLGAADEDVTPAVNCNKDNRQQLTDLYTIIL